MDEMADDVIELLDTLHLDIPVVVGGCRWGVTWRSRSWRGNPERVVP